MNPLVVGGVIAALLAGPPLYSLVQHGQLDGTTAFERWLLVTAVCAVGAGYILKIIKGYEEDWRHKDEEEARQAANEARAEAQRKAEAAQSTNPGPNGTPPNQGS
jgi:hypothetical protein